MAELILHETANSENCYKIVLAASLLGTKLSKRIKYSTVNGETRTPEYLANVNSNGKVPVLQIGSDTFLPESNAAIHYLAHDSDLIPTDRLQHAQMLQWMFFEQYSHEPNIATFRSWAIFLGLENLFEDRKAAIPEKKKNGEAALDVMEKHLAGKKFFVAEKVTLADVALYAYTHRAHESTFFDLKDWPSVKAWCERVAALPGYVSLDEK